MDKQNNTSKQRCSALSALDEYLSSPGHKSGPVLHDPDELGEENIRILTEEGILKEVLDGWFVVSFAKKDDDPTDWYRAYWKFIVAYLDFQYQEQWCLSADCSLDFYSGDTLVPEDLVIRSASAQGIVLELPFNTFLVQVQGDIPADTVREERYGVRLFPLPMALMKATDDYFDHHTTEARACLAKLTDTSDIIGIAKAEHLPDRALMFATELHNFGHPEMADTIKDAINKYMKEAEEVYFPQNDMPLRMKGTATAGNRIRLLWRNLRHRILLFKDCQDYNRHRRSVKELILRMQETLAEENHDIQFRYAPETDLPELRKDRRIQMEGSKTNGKGKTREITCDENYLKAEREVYLETGYFEAYRTVAKDILDSVTGGCKIQNVAAGHYPKWNYELFKSGAEDGVFTAADHFSDRKGWKDTCISGSRHVPVDPGEMEDAVDALSEAFQREDDPLVRAILGHFFLIYIHRFTAGNIQTAWLLMNSQLVAAGYPWIVLPYYEMEEYMKALKEAVELEHIDRLVALVARLMRASWKTDLRKLMANFDYMDNGFYD